MIRKYKKHRKYFKIYTDKEMKNYSKIRLQSKALKASFGLEDKYENI